MGTPPGGNPSAPPGEQPTPGAAPVSGGGSIVTQEGAKTLLEDPCWVPIPPPVVYPPDADFSPPLPQGTLVTLHLVDPNTGESVSMPHMATSNGDGSYTSKADTATTDPDASLEEAFDEYASPAGNGVPTLLVYVNICN